ncbi:Imm42 family immunity protein [Kosakonia sacchari]
MIIGNALEIGIQLEYIIELSSQSGLFNFIIDDRLIPGKGMVTDLYVVISSLKDSLNNKLADGVIDIGEIPLDDLDFSNGAPENVLWLDVSELSDYGCVFGWDLIGNSNVCFIQLILKKQFRKKYIQRVQ